MPDRKSLLSNVISRVEKSGLASKNTIDIAKKQTSSSSSSKRSSGSSGSKKKSSSSKQVAKKKIVSSGVLPESTKEKIKSDVMVEEEEASVKDEVVSGPASAAVQKKVTSSGVLPESTVEQVKPIVSRSVMAESPPSTPVGVKKVSSDVVVKEKTEYGLNEFYQKPYVMQRELSDQRKNIREGVAFWKPKADILPDSIKYDIGSATAGVYSGYDKALEKKELQNQELIAFSQNFRKWHPDTKIVETKTDKGTKYDVVFPYAGAEKYAYYKQRLSKAGFWGGLATAFTAEDPFGIASSYYWASGDKQRAIDTKIKAIHGTRSKDFLSFYISSPMTQVGLAAAGGIAISGISSSGIASGVSGIIGSKGVLAAKILGVGVGAAFLTKAEYDIIKTWDPLNPKGGDPGRALGMSTTLGFSIAGAYAGYNYNKPKLSLTEYKTKTGSVITGRKYLFSFRGKPHLHYGRTAIGMDKAAAEYFRSTYASKGMTYAGSDPDIGILPKYSQTRMDYLSYKPFKDIVTSTKWGNKYFVDPVVKNPVVAPQIGYKNPFAISTKVFPKPKLYRSYETYYRFIVIKKSPFKLSFKPISMKSFKKYSFKDVVKSNKDISKSLGDNVSIGKQGTITIQKTKSIQKSIVENKQITSPLSKEIVVPESLLKPVYKRSVLQKPKLKTGMQQEYKQKNVFVDKKNQSFLLNALSYKQSLKQLQIQKYATKQQSKQQSASLLASILGQSQALSVGQQQGQVMFQGLSFGQLQGVGSVLGLSMNQAQTMSLSQGQSLGMSQGLSQSQSKSKSVKKYMLIKPDFKGSGDLFKKDGQAFNVFVKDRIYVKGKKRYAERFIKINKKPLSRSDALSMGGDVVDNSAAATFKIRRTGGKPQKPGFRSPSWDYLGGKFDVRKNNLFVEPSRFRIDSRGEIKGISALGWVAEKRKKARRTRVKPVVSKKSIRMVGGDVVMDNDMSKLLRRYGF